MSEGTRLGESVKTPVHSVTSLTENSSDVVTEDDFDIDRSVNETCTMEYLVILGLDRVGF